MSELDKNSLTPPDSAVTSEAELEPAESITYKIGATAAEGGAKTRYLDPNDRRAIIREMWPYEPPASIGKYPEPKFDDDIPCSD